MLGIKNQRDVHRFDFARVGCRRKSIQRMLPANDSLGSGLTGSTMQPNDAAPP